jgi:hypothetical protein
MFSLLLSFQKESWELSFMKSTFLSFASFPWQGGYGYVTLFLFNSSCSKEIPLTPFTRGKAKSALLQRAIVIYVIYEFLLSGFPPSRE